jgi:FAD binding domain
VRADYQIAGDGNHSPIRQRVGIGVDGPGPLFTTITAIVEADLNPALRGRKVSIAYPQPQPFTILMAHDDQGRRWVFTTGYDPGTPHPRTSPTTGWPSWSGRRPACPRWRSRCGPRSRRRGGRPRDRVRGALLVRPDGLVAWRSIGRPPTHHRAQGRPPRHSEHPR